MKISFEMARLQRYSFLTGLHGRLYIEAVNQDQTKKYRIGNITPKTVDAFLLALTQLSRSSPRIMEAHHKTKLFEKYSWHWG